ncbi:hypothetical protein FRC18_001409 [Serendipita sp. 400]|nr:hypothetical protein FRC18_001409 [Serendipita sp. 400]
MAFHLDESSLSPYEKSAYIPVFLALLDEPSTTADVTEVKGSLRASFLGVDVTVINEVLHLLPAVGGRLDAASFYAGMRLLSHIKSGKEFHSDLVSVVFLGPTEQSGDTPKTPEMQNPLPDDFHQTPPKAPRPTKADLEKKISDFQKAIIPQIDAFLQRERSYWKPPECVVGQSTQEFYAKQNIPCYAGKPLLLMHNLGQGPLSPKVAEFLHDPDDSLIYNTSGSGKTRFILECLCQTWGFYLVAEPGPDEIGWKDLGKAVNSMKSAKDWVSNIFANGSPEDWVRNSSENNNIIASRAILKVLVSRWIVFQAFIQAVKRLNDGELPEKTKLDWIIFQTLPLDVGSFTQSMDPFMLCTNNCLLGVDIDTLDGQLSKFTPKSILGPKFDRQFLYVLDEAQVATRIYLGAFADTDHKIPRPVLRPIIRTMLSMTQNLPIKIFVSGTGFSYEDIDSILSSAVGKKTWKQVNDIDDFLDPDRQLAYMAHYLPPPFLGSDHGNILMSRVYDWLQGRPRFTASFAEQLLNGGWIRDAPASPHKLLNAYVKAYSTFMPVDGPKDMFEEPDVGQIFIRTFDWAHIESHPDFAADLAMTIYSYLIQGKHLPLYERHRYLIEYGLARFTRTGEIGIQEPLALVSILQYFQNNDYSLSKYLRTHLQFSRGNAFESIVLFALTELFLRHQRLGDVFAFHDDSCELARSEGSIVRRTSYGDFVPLGSIPSSPPIQLVTKAGNIREVTSWIQNGTTGWCIPPDYMGPDLLTWIQLTSSRRVLVAIQAKSYFSGNEETLSAGVMASAIHTINPKVFYSDLVCVPP